MAGRRTYWHLEGSGRVPSEYEIVTSRLLYYVEKGFEVTTPSGAWHERHQKQAAIREVRWEEFRDPRETTYAKYTALQTKQEGFLESLLEQAQKSALLDSLGASWLEGMEKLLAPVLYPWHGAQMISSYLGQMAPSGKIVVACLFQTADELRRIQWVAYLTRYFQQRNPAFGARAKQDWQTAAAWQPLRETVEKLLVTYDWTEALFALNVCLKPALDAVFLRGLGERARDSGDFLTYGILGSFADDAQWHRAWTEAALRLMMGASPEHRSVLNQWSAKWLPISRRAAVAVAALGPTPGEGLFADQELFFETVGLTPVPMPCVHSVDTCPSPT